MITIPANTIVQRDDSKLITLCGSVYARANRQVDGGYIYTVSGRQYYVSAGCVKAERPDTLEVIGWRHKTGLIDLVG